MGESCSTHGEYEKCLQNFSQKTWMEDLEDGIEVDIKEVVRVQIGSG